MKKLGTKLAHRTLLSAAAAAALAVTGCEPDAQALSPGQSPVSGPIALTADDAFLVVAAEDHDAVLVIDRASREVVKRIAVGDAPSHLVVDGNRVVVSARYGSTLSVIDLSKGEVTKTIPVGTEPVGLTFIDENRVAVALAGDDAVAVVDVDAGRVVTTIPLPDTDPRAVALLKNGDLYVTHMSTGNFSRVNLQTGTARLVGVNTPNNFGAALKAEHLRSLTVDPENGNVLVAHSQANSDTVRAPIGDPNVVDPIGDQGCGYSGCPTQLGAVVPGVTEVDDDTDIVVVPQSASSNTNVNGCFECDVAIGGFGGQAAAPPSVLNPFDGRFNGVQIANPAALALFDGSRGELVVNLGTKNVVMLRRTLDGTAADVLGVVKVGNGADGIAVAHDSKSAFVWNQFDGTISEIALPDVDVGQTNTRFAADDKATVAELSVVPEFAADTFTVVEDALPADVSIGRKMFHDATDSRIAASGTISCASCHPDGRTDNQVWKFTFGPRNTPQLGGSILDTAPFHWPGDVPTVAALNDMTVLPFMGGNGLDAGSFQFVASFIDTIRAAPSAAQVKGELTASELRGKAIFESAESGCTACHSGAHFTDNVAYDIGSASNLIGTDIRAFQTPVLHGLRRTAPYFHDGKFKNLEDLVDNGVRNDQMGKGSHLSDQDASDLVAYLKTL